MELEGRKSAMVCSIFPSSMCGDGTPEVLGQRLWRGLGWVAGSPRGLISDAGQGRET